MDFTQPPKEFFYKHMHIASILVLGILLPMPAFALAAARLRRSNTRLNSSEGRAVIN